MDVKVLARNYVWPLVFFIVNGSFVWVSHRYPVAFELMEDAGITPMWVMTIVAALLGFLMAKFNPVGGKDQRWFVPDSKHGETPTLRKPDNKR